MVQWKILKNILEHIEIPSYIYAFERAKSIPVMVQEHVGKKLVVSMDIKDFFHSIKQEQLKALFLELGFGDKPSILMSELCTYKWYVPQGALTSPKISNIIASKTFGPILKDYCDKHELSLTIYADDITISANSTDVDTGAILQTIREAVTGAGFRINNEKTKIMTRAGRQWVCGVVVNEKPNLLKKERLKLRAMVHNTTKNGIEAEAQKSNMTPGLFLDHLKGKLNWYKQLNPDKAVILINQLKEYLESSQNSSSNSISTTTSEQAPEPLEVTEPAPW